MATSKNPSAVMFTEHIKHYKCTITEAQWKELAVCAATVSTSINPVRLFGSVVRLVSARQQQGILMARKYHNDLALCKLPIVGMSWTTPTKNLMSADHHDGLSRCPPL